MKRIKKLLSLLITFTLIFTMSGVVYAAADDTATISAYEKTERKWQNFQQLLVRSKKMTISIITKMHPEKQIKRPGGRKIRTGSMYIMSAQRDM